MHRSKTSYNPLRRVSSMASMLFIFLCSFSLFPSSTKAQSTGDLVQDKKYTFTVQTIQPFRGTLRPDMQSPGYYKLKITSDSIISNLPFFGRSYMATIGSSESPLVFTSTKFDYKITERKKGGWDISIKPRDINNVQEMMLTVFTDGNASLRVNSTSRDPMAFQGLVSAK